MEPVTVAGSGKGMVKRMMKVIGVRFRTAGKVYFFDPLDFDIKRGDNVIVETARGIEFGTVVSGVREMDEEKVIQPLKPVLRIANQRDKDQEAGNKIKEREAFRVCQEKIRKHGLEMKLIDAEYTFDNNKVLFYFTADGRIDFRELVKDLAGVFKTRIELRQIGVRDETKIMGGIGICGRALCCHSYLSDFIPVSIKMAKEQNLSLNPTKISGVCGRLMCCLKNEEETYEELNRRLPNIGDIVTTEEGHKGEVQSVNVLRQLVTVLVENGDEKERKEYEVGKLHFKRRHTKKDRQNLSPEELAELERLEREDFIPEERAEGGRPEKDERQHRGGNSQRHSDERKDRGERSEGREHRGRQDRGSRQERSERRESQGNPERSERREGQGNPERSERREVAQGQDRGEHRGGQTGGEHREGQRNRQNHDRNRNRKDRGEHRESQGNPERSERREGQGSPKNRNHSRNRGNNRNGNRSGDTPGTVGGEQ